MQTIILHINILQSVTIIGDNRNEGVINGRITNYIVNNFDVIQSLVMFLLFVVATFASLKIYNKWQAGDSDNIEYDIAKWFGGLVIVLALMYFLYEVAKGNLAGYSI